METSLIAAVFATAITAGTPILFAALGEIFTERAGILNLGVEGMMLVGAVTGFMVAYKTGNPWFGVLASMLAGGLLSFIHALLTVTLKANQVVSGLALTIFGTGLSGYLGKAFIGQPLPNPFKAEKLGLLGDIPVIGPVLFQQDPLVYLSFVLVPLSWFFIFRTKMGLNLRAVGENPGAADSLGVSVSKTRYLYTMVGGMLAGIGGAYLSLVYAPAWMENMTAGRGWIAVALVIFSTWNPLYALVGAYMFGGIDALGFRMQLLDVQIPSYFLSMLPYICTILILILTTYKAQRNGVGAPKALGLSYDREER
ncbi:simple sugar transport system permease protein [Desulfohalotomaculum tongense]|uniref:ABC transporter permease n=1 Tax=Desulforadius tongensis TaxID=1216062 RepID=UPI001957C29A|nr:ABC transporter permease [Desulforadius tongensis]MBM7855914.1 simple sugar transport system permease protein [Desulforadius tongensis]